MSAAETGGASDGAVRRDHARGVGPRRRRAPRRATTAPLAHSARHLDRPPADPATSRYATSSSCLASPPTHPLNGPFSGTTRVSRYQKGKPIWILLKQETVSGSGISWAQCKSAPRSRQITMPATHHSVLEAGCPSCRPTNSVKAPKASVSACQRVVNKQYKYRLSLTDPRDESDVQSINQ